MPTDALPSQPSQPPSTSDSSQPTQPVAASTSAASRYPHSVTTAANIPLHISPLSAAPPLPDDTRGRSSGTPQPPATKVARTAPTTPYVPSHLLRFDNPFDPAYNQTRHDALSKLHFPQTPHEEYNFWVSLYYFVCTPQQYRCTCIRLQSFRPSNSPHIQPQQLRFLIHVCTRYLHFSQLVCGLILARSQSLPLHCSRSSSH